MSTTPAPVSLSQRRQGAPHRIALPGPSLPSLAPHQSSLAVPQDTFGFVPVRPQGRRTGSRETSVSVPYVPTPWAGAATSPNVQVSPAAVDYFNQHTAQRQSWRAMQNLALVAGGRTLLSLGLAGVLNGFAPGSILNAGAPIAADAPPQAPHPFDGAAIHHRAVFALGLTGAIVGLAAHTAGLARFYSDTASINARRAALVLTVGTLGAVLITAGGAFYLYGVIDRRDTIAWEALPMRSLGNFCVYGAIPNSFSASEIVHGDIPLKNRVFWRDVFFALGGMFLMTWAQISVPTPPAPLWAREIAQCMGIICIAMGGALPRVDSQRAAAKFREMQRRRAGGGELT